MLFRALFFALVVIASSAFGARGDFISSGRWFNALDDKERFALQVNLVLAGHYYRYVDGEFGPGTFQAITSFQRELGGRTDGVMSDAQLSALDSLSRELFNELGFEETRDVRARLSIYVPSNVFRSVTSTQRGTRYEGAGGAIILETFGRPLAEQSFPTLYERLQETTARRRVTYSTFKANTFTVSGQESDQNFYTRYYSDGYLSSGFSLSWTREYGELGRMLSIMLANFSEQMGAEDEAVGTNAEQPPKKPSSTNLGSGFFVNSYGLIVTNFHVAGICQSITVPGHGEATLVKGDEELDLAAIELKKGTAPAWAAIRSTAPNLAEPVVLLGYPLASLLDSSLNVSTGIVSAETGLGGNRQWFTTNAGLQPGNSGGPILDETGAVVGVAVAKMDDAKMLEATGNVASNVGFGIKSDTLTKFLRVFKYTEASSDAPLTPQVAAQEGKRFTVQIVCES